MGNPLRLLTLELGSTAAGRGVIEELRHLIPGVWIAGVEKQKDYESTAFDLVVTTQYDAFLGRYESVNTANLAMTPELSNLMAPYEGKILNLLGLAAVRPASDYPDPIYGVPKFQDSYDSRKDLFNRHCRFWNFILDHYKIDAVIHENLGQEGYDYVALQLARAKGIPTLVFNTSGQLPRVLFVQEDEFGVGQLNFAGEIKSSLQGSLRHEVSDFIRRSLNHFKTNPDSGLKASVNNSQYQTNPVISWLFDQNINLNSARWNTLMSSLINKVLRGLQHPLSSWRTLGRSRAMIRETQRSILEEERCSTEPDLDSPYVYFPLHCQPETSSSIKAKNFYRLREAVAFFASELPGDWTLVVKEHPHQLRRLRPREPGFFDQIASIDGVQLVRSSSANQRLIDGAVAVACVSHSSITANAAFNGIPVISLGESHFREAPGYFCVETSADLRKAIELVRTNQVGRKDGDLENFIARLERSTFEGEFGEQFVDVSDDDWARTMAATRHNISRVIREWLRLRGLVK